MSRLLLLTNSPHSDVLPALDVLGHEVRSAPASVNALVDVGPVDALLLDGRAAVLESRSLCAVIRTTGVSAPLLLVTTEGGLVAVTAEWGLDDILLDTAGPAEVEARLRLAIVRVERAQKGAAGPPGSRPDEALGEIRRGDLMLNASAYTARVNERVLDLTYKEFELLKYLFQHPGRVFNRAQLLAAVWGYDDYGGTRTIDVHVRRLRAKLGPDHESLIGTVRNVGYLFVTEPRETHPPFRPDHAVATPSGGARARLSHLPHFGLDHAGP